MAITTYSELKTALANWSKRTDLTAMMGDFIALAESRIQRSLLARAQEVETELTMAPGSRYVALPSDFDSPAPCGSRPTCRAKNSPSPARTAHGIEYQRLPRSLGR